MQEPDRFPERHERHGVLTPSRIDVAAAVVWSGDRILLTQRPPGGPLGLQWELPGGKVEPGETPAHALVREVREELGVEARPHEDVQVDVHDYPHGLEVQIHFIRCELASHEFRPSTAVHAWRWARPADLDLGEVLAGDRDFLAGLGARG